MSYLESLEVLSFMVMTLLLEENGRSIVLSSRQRRFEIDELE